MLSFEALCTASMVCSTWNTISKNKDIWRVQMEKNEKILLKPSKDIPIWEDQNLPTPNLRSDTSIDFQKLTLNQLVARLTPGAQAVVDPNDYAAFLTTYKSFTTPQNLVRKLVQRYHVPEKPKENSTPEEVKAWHKSVVKPIQLRVCKIMKAIVDDHFDDLDEATTHYMRILFRGIMSQDLFSKSLIHAFTKRSKEEGNEESQSSSTAATQANKTSKKSFVYRVSAPLRQIQDIFDVKSKVIAEQLTIIEFEYFKDIKPDEFISIGDKPKSASDSKHAMSMPKMIAHFNDVSRWVQETILNEERCKLRARKMEKFIRTAQYLRMLNNFETMMAITSSLGDTAIHRLTYTKAEVGQEYTKILEELNELMTSDKSYANYRKAIREAIDETLPCIPYIGVYRRDLIYHEEGQKNDGAINFTKSRQIFGIIQEIKSFQQSPYDFRVHPSVSAHLRALPQLPPGVNHEEYKKTTLYELSLKREPRNASRSSILV